MSRHTLHKTFLESAENYHFLIENSPVGVLVLDADLRIVSCNIQARRLLELTQEEISGRFQYHPDRKFMKADGSLIPEEENPILRSVKTFIPFKDFLCGIVRPISGEIIWILADAQLQNNEAGRLYRIILTLNDITNRKEAQEALAQSEARYRFLIEKMSDIVWTADINLTVSYVSPSIEQALGYAPEEFLKQSYLGQLTSGSPVNVPELMNQALMRDRAGQLGPDETNTFDVSVRHRNGSVVWFSNVVRFIRDENGNITGLYGVARNITEQKLAAEERERLIAELKRALSDVKTLSGLLPICSQCKKIRDDRGYWNQLEAYLSEHSAALFSHSICPDCAARLYPDFFPPKKKPPSG